MWVIFSILAAAVWGFDYVFAEKVVKHISVLTFMAIQLFFAFVVAALAALLFGSVRQDFVVLASSRYLLLYFVLGILAFTAGNFFILVSISAKNATLAGMIEISYPLFIALFAYLIFKENQINLATVLGGILIFAGVFIIYFFNK